MTMWSTEWMILYALTILIGNIAVIAFASRANRRNKRRSQTEKSDHLREWAREPSQPAN